MRFRHRQRVGPAVDLARAGEDDLDPRVVAAARLEDRQLAAAVDLEIRVRILHAVDVADLAGEIEDDVLIAHQVIHGALLPHVGDVDAQPVLDAADVEQVAAVVGDQRVDDRARGRRARRAGAQVAADEAQAAGDHHRAIAVEGAVVDGAGLRLRSRRDSSRALSADLVEHHQLQPAAGEIQVGPDDTARA